MNRSSASSLCLACGSVLLLGLAFVFLPWAWNLLPLVLLAVVLGILWARRGCPPVAPARDARMPAIEPPVQMTGGSGLNGNPKCARRANRAFGPIAAGLIIDLVDFATFGPIGLILGLPLGGLAGYWMGSALGLSRRAALGCALAAGVYCTIPGTELIPLATILGAVVRFRESGRRSPSGAPREKARPGNPKPDRPRGAGGGEAP